MKTFLSVIIPLYNEERRLNHLSMIHQYLNKVSWNYEILLVNDGSLDNTLSKLKQFSKKFRYRIISYEGNQGKGFAIRTGILKATGNYRLFTDIDLSTPIDEFNKFIPHLNNFDVLIGSRRKKGAKLVIHQPILREQLGQGFTRLSQLTLGLMLTDFTCGFKVFSKVAAEAIFKRSKINRWGFDSEILFIAKKLGFKIKEIPVTWQNDSETKVRLPHDIISSLSDLIKIRYNDFKQIYH